MADLSKKIDELNDNLFVVLENLNNIDDENFEANIGKISSLAALIEEKSNFAKNSFDFNKLLAKSDAHHRTVKLIKEKFDSIIEEKKTEQKKISEELSKILNKKKLINYQR